MMKQQPLFALALLVLHFTIATTFAFVSRPTFAARIVQQVRVEVRARANQLFSTNPENESNVFDNDDNGSARMNKQDDDPTQELLLSGNAIEEQMRSLKSKYPTSEADYLAAARKRAQEARASINSGASDDEWQQMATQQQQQLGDSDEDWEKSLQDSENNAESQILIPKVAASQAGNGDNNDEDEEEPKLLLF